MSMAGLTEILRFADNYNTKKDKNLHTTLVFAPPLYLLPLVLAGLTPDWGWRSGDWGNAGAR